MDTFQGFDHENEDTRELEFRTSLYTFGLRGEQVDVLTLRFFYELTFSEISTKLNMPYRQDSFYVYKQAIQLLKERGYNV